MRSRCSSMAIKIPKGMTVLQACEVAGVEIPRFCYHKLPKPVASCTMPALPG
ncbi:hypothetical protein ACSBR2_033439 [Camellia fascicularis]